MSTIDYTNNLFKEIDKRFDGKVSYNFDVQNNRLKIGFYSKLTAENANKLLFIVNIFDRLHFECMEVSANNEITFVYSLKIL